MEENSPVHAARLANAEHEVQLDLMTELRDAFGSNGTTESATAEVRARLINCSRAHFDAEETLMRQHAYPDYEAHRSEHRQLLEIIGQAADANAVAAAMTVLRQHIGQHDSRVHAFLLRPN